MLCAFCKKDSLTIGWDETSHLGKRPICYTCIGKRDEQTMKTRRCIILYFEEGRLWNLTKTLSFKIMQQVDRITYTHIVFLVNKKRWIGVMHGNRVLCRKYKL